MTQYPIFYVVDKKRTSVQIFDTPSSTAAHMLGRVITDYIIIKCSLDAQGAPVDRIVNSPSRNIKHLELQLALV